MSLHIVQFHETYLEDAVALFNSRYRALREQEPLMPSRYGDPDAILPLLHHLSKDNPGVVALDGTKLVGFLLGFVIPEFLGRRSMYSREWANGAELQRSRRIYEEMYERLSADWVADGCLTHIVTMLSSDRLGVEAWQWLGFGLAAVDAIRGLEPVQGSEANVTVRRATLEDVGVVNAFDQALEQHMALPPIFWLHELRDYDQWLRQPSNAFWLAYEGSEPVGGMALEPGYTEACQITRDEKTVSITHAFTKEPARSKGVATALLNTSLAWARTEGYERCTVDFESMNYLAARFWMRYFEPVCISLLRVISLS